MKCPNCKSENVSFTPAIRGRPQYIRGEIIGSYPAQWRCFSCGFVWFPDMNTETQVEGFRITRKIHGG